MQKRACVWYDGSMVATFVSHNVGDPVPKRFLRKPLLRKASEEHGAWKWQSNEKWFSMVTGTELMPEGASFDIDLDANGFEILIGDRSYTRLEIKTAFGRGIQFNGDSGSIFSRLLRALLSEQIFEGRRVDRRMRTAAAAVHAANMRVLEANDYWRELYKNPQTSTLKLQQGLHSDRYAALQRGIRKHLIETFERMDMLLAVVIPPTKRDGMRVIFIEPHRFGIQLCNFSAGRQGKVQALLDFSPSVHPDLGVLRLFQ